MWHLLFIVALILVGVRRIALIPLLGGVALLLFASPKSTKESAKQLGVQSFLQDHTITLSWILIMVGLRGFLDVITGGSLEVGLRLVGVNLAFWITSYVFGYHDGKEVFHYGWYFSSLLFLVSLGRLGDYGLLLDMAVLWFSVTMAVYAFIVFVVGAVDKTVGRTLHYPLFITFNCCVVYLIYYYTQQNIGLSLAGAQAYLLLVYGGIWHVLYDYNNEFIYDNEEDLFRHILSGQTITRFKQSFSKSTLELYDDIRNFLMGMGSTSKSVMGLLNIVLVLGQAFLFVVHIREGVQWFDYLWFWAGVLLFFGSFILLRSIGYAYKLQRVVAFILLNVALYMTIIALFGNNIIYIVGLGIVWTIINSVFIIQRKLFDPRGILVNEDIYYRILGTVVTTLCNLYFLIRIPLSFQVIFSLICLYLGVQVVLIRYSLHSLK